MLGYGYMGRVHSQAYARLAATAPLRPRLAVICGRTEEPLAAAAAEYGFARHTTDWRALVEAGDVQLFDNGAPPAAHAEPTIAAAEAGKHVVCEKPLGRSAEESYELWRRVAGTGVVHMCAFNYRFVPAVARARELIAAGEVGDVRHFRGRYLQEWLADPAFPVDWRLRAETAGAGAVLDLGSHVADLARFLVGEPRTVSGAVATFTTVRPGGRVDVDDAFAAAVEFEGGAIGTLEASRVCGGRGDDLRWEVNGSRGSLAFALERPNELRAARHGGEGFEAVAVPGPEGGPIVWADLFVLELGHLLEAIAAGTGVGPAGATLEDGYRAAEVCEAILRSASHGTREAVRFREPPPTSGGSRSG